MNDEQKASFDREVRRYVYDRIMTAGVVPAAAEAASGLGAALPEAREAFQRLAQGRVLVLQENGEILMANPFSAVPTPFLVEVAGRSWWGNCIWDALGIPAMLKADARITTACGDCSDAMRLEIRDSARAEGSGIIHCSVPAKRWWENIKFT